MGRRVLVYGLGLSGRAAARHLLADGDDVVVADDDGGPGPAEAAAELGVELRRAPDRDQLAALARDLDEVVVSPGVPAGHPVMALADAVPVVGEVELAWRRSRVPLLAVTGTNGKTTVVTLVTDMLRESGVRALAAGNIGLPLLDAVDEDTDAVVAEVSSFQLALTADFRPSVGAWVNFAPDHLDWHPTLEHYRASKAKVWANAGAGDVVVANAEDDVVMAAVAVPASRGAAVRRFGLGDGDFRLADGELVGPDGAICAVAELGRPFPHEIADALCAAAVATAAGAGVAGCASALRRFRGLPHRLELVGEANGVKFYDDSKATTPDAVVAALSGFSSAVLVAGGRNKGLDLTPLAALADRLTAVVAMGEAAGELEQVFSGRCPVRVVSGMADAVTTAAEAARPGDAVVLSPACTSFDWYSSYAERGADFAGHVRMLIGATGSAS